MRSAEHDYTMRDATSLIGCLHYQSDLTNLSIEQLLRVFKGSMVCLVYIKNRWDNKLLSISQCAGALRQQLRAARVITAAHLRLFDQGLESVSFKCPLTGSHSDPNGAPNYCFIKGRCTEKIIN